MRLRLHKNLLFAGLAATLALTACDDNDCSNLSKLDPNYPGGSTDNGYNENCNDASQNAVLARLEIPQVIGDNQNVVLVRTVPDFGVNYVIEYNLVKRSQRWTAFQWYNGNSGTPWDRNNWDKETDNPWAMRNLREYGWGDPFQPDPDLPEYARTNLEEYYDCGYQRGHICASGDRLNSKDANEQTFYLSNIMPQHRNLNNGIWLTMENQVARKWNSSQFRQTLYVVKGGTTFLEGISLPGITFFGGILLPRITFLEGMPPLVLLSYRPLVLLSYRPLVLKS